MGCIVKPLQDTPALGLYRPQKSVGSVPCSNSWVTNLMVFNQPRIDSRHRQIKASQHQNKNMSIILGGDEIQKMKFKYRIKEITFGDGRIVYVPQAGRFVFWSNINYSGYDGYCIEESMCTDINSAKKQIKKHKSRIIVKKRKIKVK